MARVRNNVAIRGLTGSFGDQMVIKIDKAGRTIVANKSEFDENRVFTAPQLAQQEKFREAAAYAKGARSLPVYAAKAEGTPMHPYNVAVADFLLPPQIKAIDLSGWTGEPRQVIRVQALDNVEVKSVNVTILDATDAVLEQGPATKGDGGWWTYETTASAAGNPRVRATAEDLPGHTATLTQSRN